MKIKSVKREEDKYHIYIVEWEPNWLEKLFGKKPVIEQWKDTGSTYMFGGSSEYIDRDGDSCGNGSEVGEAIDRFRRAW
jgi:hypothetical protein